MHLQGKIMTKYFVLQSLHKAPPSTTLYYKACTKNAKSSEYCFVLQSLHKARPSTTLYYKACTKRVPVLLCTTKLAQSTSQYFLCYKACTKHLTSQYHFVRQSLHKARPSTTLYDKACTKYFPILLVLQSLHKALDFPVPLCSTKLAQSTSQYYFVRQSLHKARPSTTLYYKACTKYSQYYFVLQSLQKALPRTTLYYRACAKHFPDPCQNNPYKKGGLKLLTKQKTNGIL